MRGETGGVRRGDYVLATASTAPRHSACHVPEGRCRLMRVIRATRDRRARHVIGVEHFDRAGADAEACVCIGIGDEAWAREAKWRKGQGAVSVMLIGSVPVFRGRKWTREDTEWASVSDARQAIRAMIEGG